MFRFDRFEEMRSKMGITKKFVADSISRKSQIIQDWRAGKSEPSDEQLAVVARILRVTPDYLRGLEDEYGLTPEDWCSMGRLYGEYIASRGRDLSECVDGEVVSLYDAQAFVTEGVSLTTAQLDVLCGRADTTVPDLFAAWADRLYGQKNKPAAQGDGLEYLSEKERALLHSYRTMTEEQVNAMDVFIRGIKNAD